MKGRMIMKKILILFISLAMTLSIISCSDSETDQAKELVNTPIESDKPKEESKEDLKEEKIDLETEKEDPILTDKKEEDVPREFKSALSQADTYANTMYMSKAGLYDQLTSEYGGKFPKDAAQYAIDNVDANWEENALNKAETYGNTMHMSKKGIYEQLTSEYGEQFTDEEAQYAIDNVEMNWKENALNKAKTYANEMNMSDSAVYDQLVSEYGEQFTEDEAQYAIDNLN